MKQVEWLGWFLYYDGVGVALLPAQALPVYHNFHFNYCTFLLGLSATNCAKCLQGCELQIWQDLSSYRCQNDHLQKIRSWHGHGSWVRERMGVEVKYFWCSEIYLTIRHILDHSPEDQQTQNFHHENRNWIFHHWLVYSLIYIGLIFSTFKIGLEFDRISLWQVRTNYQRQKSWTLHELGLNHWLVFCVKNIQ